MSDPRNNDDRQKWRGLYDDLVEAARRGGVDGPYVGSRTPRRDVLDKVRGKAGYAANLSLPGMLHARFLRSIYPSARILRMDLDQARAVPGVMAVLSAADLPEDRLYIGSVVQDTPIFAHGVVRHVGEPVAVVAAETVEAAEAALELIEVDYKPLTPVLDCAAALAPGSPALHPDGNTLTDLNLDIGDVDAALAAADVVIEGTYRCEPIEHCHLEPHAGIAHVDENGVLVLHVPQQWPHFQHRQLARITGLPMERVHVIPTVIGGAFGGKNDVTVECALALLALKTGRPVRMVLDREEVFNSTIKRHAMTIRHRLGASSDGRITAIDVDVECDGGAYASYSIVVAGRCLIHPSQPYDVANVRAHVRTLFTNNPPSGAMRSFGVVKLAFATETQVNKLAARLGMSPIALRRLNAARNGTRMVTGQVLKDAAFVETLDAIEPIYEARRRALAAAPAGPRRKGLGIASLGYGIGYTGTRNPSRARAELTADGQLRVFCGTPDVGTGSDTVMAQIAAEEMGVSFGRVRVTTGDSVSTDESGPTSASRTTYFSGNAVRQATGRLRDGLLKAAATAYGVGENEVRLEGDRLLVRNEALPLEDVCRRIDVASLTAEGICDPLVELDFKTGTGEVYPCYAFGTHLAEIELDDETGQVHVSDYWAAHDAGKVINPVAAEGQVEGGIVMGLGMALWEKVARADGYILNPSYRDYLLPGARDVPPIKALFVENAEPTGPFGAKGIAEPCIVATPAAVGAAIHDAAGVVPHRLPMEAETIADLIEAARDNKGAA